VGEGTHTFVSYDGLEYSEPLNLTVVKNEKPQLSLGSASSTGTTLTTIL
jgi:hypothetical protein